MLDLTCNFKIAFVRLALLELEYLASEDYLYCLRLTYHQSNVKCVCLPIIWCSARYTMC